MGSFIVVFFSFMLFVKTIVPDYINCESFDCWIRTICLFFAIYLQFNSGFFVLVFQKI